mmetsp:Transcript_15112/g.31747  ORF Transcript_15112/g.31747 Transcript_15112/m.31747 type:complete len:125 (-) Transcript_15112:399-773(-)
MDTFGMLLSRPPLALVPSAGRFVPAPLAATLPPTATPNPPLEDEGGGPGGGGRVPGAGGRGGGGFEDGGPGGGGGRRDGGGGGGGPRGGMRWDMVAVDDAMGACVAGFSREGKIVACWARLQRA